MTEPDPFRGVVALSPECRRNHEGCPHWSCATKPGSWLAWDCECPCHGARR